MGGGDISCKEKVRSSISMFIARYDVKPMIELFLGKRVLCV